jgi:hypothetical protein
MQFLPIFYYYFIFSNSLFFLFYFVSWRRLMIHHTDADCEKKSPP